MGPVVPLALLAIGALALFGTSVFSMGDPGPALRGGVARQSVVVMVVLMEMTFGNTTPQLMCGPKKQISVE